jgi:hypothetical protein
MLKEAITMAKNEEVVAEQEVVEAEGTEATATGLTEEQRNKQADAMRKRWQDPEYVARVKAGREAAKAKKAAEAPATEEVASEDLPDAAE